MFELRKDPRGREYYWQAGERINDTQENSDILAVENNYVSITPMHSDLTDFKQYDLWQKIVNTNKQE